MGLRRSVSVEEATCDVLLRPAIWDVREDRDFSPRDDQEDALFWQNKCWIKHLSRALWWGLGGRCHPLVLWEEILFKTTWNYQLENNNWRSPGHNRADTDLCRHRMSQDANLASPASFPFLSQFAALHTLLWKMKRGLNIIHFLYTKLGAYKLCRNFLALCFSQQAW